FASWYMIETYYDFGHVVVSRDLENWEQLARYDGNANYWQIEEVDLSDYAGEVIYIGFNLLTDDGLTRVGWYIDDVEITDQSIGASNVKQTLDSSELVQKKKAVNPDKIKPIIEDMPTIDNNRINSLVLPIEASVTVLETSRSGRTNPANGRYNLFHKAGEYTVVAESYG
ncbi:hypothetical protein J4G37_46455, partial [Microvirga sp. 3-52]|nr:hypothetical protein [Microvirga sp. 3-52]